MRDIRERVESSSMSPYQWLIVALCVLLNAQDGFDISAVAYTSTGISEEWGLSGTELGAVISAGLIGIVAGAFLLTPLADVWGRRPCILISLALTGIGMFASAAADSPLQLTIWRVVTGIGIGAVTASINVVVAEYTTPRFRSASIGIYAAGFGVGATLGGVAAATLVGAHGWRSVFVVGGILALVSMTLILVLLPESIDFLAQRRGPAALTRVNRILRRIGVDPVEQIVVEHAGGRGPVAARQIAGLFGPSLRRPTLILWAAFFCAMFAFYFLTSWTPRLTVLAGYDARAAALVGTMLSVGGAVGAVGFGLIAIRVGVPRLLLGFGALGVVALLGLGLSLGSLPALLGVGFVAGLLANGAIVGLFTLAPALYPAAMRATGVGWANGIGRSGSILAPLLVGALVDREWPPFLLYLLGAAFLVGLVVAVAGYRWRVGQPALT